MINVLQIKDNKEKQLITRNILEALPEWFATEKAREEYIRNSIENKFFCAYDKNTPTGFIYLKQTGADTVEIAVMGVLKDYHRKSIGKMLFEEAKEIAVKEGYSFIQVKTVQMGIYEDYDRTSHFYKSLGFKEFEVFPTLWDESNPCQIYVMALR